MSLPHNGSTAPVVTSPLLAWPARPSTRSSPMSTPSSDTFDDASPSYPSRKASSSTTAFSVSVSDGRWSSSKGKERAVEGPQVRVYEHDDAEEEVGQRERHYGPPKKPLNPHQLGRIAQSFGVIIPHLPQQPTPISPTNQRPLSPASSYSQIARPKGRLSPLLGSQAPTRPSPFLLSVIPPLSLLPPTPAATPEQALKTAKRWRRGRLLPLQPTLGSMLVCIAREYGLPSTVGLGVYLVLPGGLSRGVGSSSSAGSSYSSESDEPSGPLVSSSTWSTLFAPHLVQATSTTFASRSSTPSHTPMKGSIGHLDAEAPYPPSPLSMALKSSTSQPTSLGHRPKVRSLSTEPLSKPPDMSHTSHPSTSSSTAMLPPTPASLGTLDTSAPSPNPIVGTIEFDVDMDEATWFEDWRRSGGITRHKRTLTAGSAGGRGMKELELVNRAADERPRFLKDLDVNRPTPERRRLSVEAHNLQVVSASASFSEFSDDVTPDDEEKLEQRRASEGMLAVGDADAKDLLASPIELELVDEGGLVGSLNASTSLKVQEILDKRGSGLVMAEQLDDLEKMMRQLSPREIRLTSPRLLTPRMAAKVANLSLPAVPRRNLARPAPSPLAGGFVSPNPNELDVDPDRDDYANVESSVPDSATGSTHTFGSTLPHEQEQSHPGADDDDIHAPLKEEYEPPKPSWPAVPHGANSPGSPSSIQEFFARPAPAQRNVSSPASISKETMQRMQSELPSNKPAAASEWVPRRPARPPSPKLDHQRTLSHTLSPEFVDFLHRSPPHQTHSQGSIGMGNDEVISPEGSGRKTRRSGSISLKGLRHQMSAKNIGHMWKSDAAASPPMPGRDKETVGLFKGGLDSDSSSSFPGLLSNQGQGQRSVSNPILGSASSTQTDFGPPLPIPTADAADAHAMNTSNSLPHSNKGGRFASKIFGFGKRDHSSSAATASSGDKEKRSRRQPSHDNVAGAASLQISPPITSSFVHAQTQAPSHGSTLQMMDSTPESAALPLGHNASQHQALGHGRAPSQPTHAHSPSFSSGTGTGNGVGYNAGVPPVPPSPHIPASPNTPASPHSVRRKPVPGVSSGDGSSAAVKNSMSLGSMASFVLEDPPKGRRGLGMGMGI
ncbi:hypothetical protein I316_00993 [Kwoniella heveanensis BCC8398]|uniref:Uncharacterized protein n=1 Tax=Kwoniella heveanensis BCC8398 TaxID=1296120 RepID=A0A1B9H1C7_9TREE|nr:hypothetical protein I316_00993 [Kwoniella heveanensis BCC8398]